MSETPEIVTVLLPEDEFTHEPDPVPNYNESMYLNGFDLTQGLGAWFRLGNRVNEGYAEMSVCLYLPDGRVGFMFGRPKIETNDEMKAGGLEISVVTPFEHLTVSYDGKVVVLDEPEQMTNPREAFRDNPTVACRVRLDVHGVSPMYGGKPQYADGTEIEVDAQNSFAKAHYEQHTRVTGTIELGRDCQGNVRWQVGPEDDHCRIQGEDGPKRGDPVQVLEPPVQSLSGVRERLLHTAVELIASPDHNYAFHS